MKKIHYLPVVLAAIVTLACTKTQYDDYAPTTGGTANFATYISVGNSLTQGYQDGGLHNEYQQQANSYPSIIAKQMGVNFLQPMVDGNGSGHKFLQNLGTSPTITDVIPESNWSAATGWSTWNKATKYNNLGVAGIRLTDCVPTNGVLFSPEVNQFMTQAANPYGSFLDFGIFGATAPISYLEHVKTSNATFYTCWLGNNDVLGWALAGGNDGNLDLSAYGLSIVKTSELTPPVIFRNKYDSILDAFQALGAKGVCATLPDVTSIPFFTTVPYNPIPMDQATATSTNSAYAAYNSGLDGLVAAGMLSASEAAKRKINFTASNNNAIVIIDESLTDLTAINPALINMRQATANDLILLSATSDIGRQLNPLDPASIYGVAVPFADSLVLTETEVNTVQSHTNVLNNEINSSASVHGVVVVDMYNFMFDLQSGMTFDGIDFTAKYIEGGAFSLDGVHPNSRGYAIIANKFMKVINDTYGSNLRPVPVQNYRGIIFP